MYGECLYGNCGQKTEVKPKKCVCELLWCVGRKEKSPGTGGKGLLICPKDQQQGKEDVWKTSRIEWEMSGFELIMSRFEWKTSTFKGNGAAEVDDLLRLPATG